jgi:hypothetical protein
VKRLRSGPRRRRAWAPLGAAAAAAAATVAAALYTRRGRDVGIDGRRPWTCECGQAYLVSGIDRHRVYWLPDAAQSDPLLARECVSCGAALPAGHEAAVV